MAYNIVGLVFFINVLQLGMSVSHTTVYVRMHEEEIVPDVTPMAPADYLRVTYEKEVEVHLGNELTPTEVQNEPFVYWLADPEAFYTLTMIDPDAPSRIDPILREWQHWLVVNIPGATRVKGRTLSEYIGAGPPLGTGFHRYVFLLYKQPTKLKFKEPYRNNRSRYGRSEFNVTKFAKKYNLGSPLAGNFFKAQYDSYVPILHNKLEPF